MPHRRVDGQNRIRHARGRNLERIAANAHGDDLSVLRRRMRTYGTRAGRPNRESELAARPFRHARESLHQGPLRLAIHAEVNRTLHVTPTPTFFVTAHFKGVTRGPFRNCTF